MVLVVASEPIAVAAVVEPHGKPAGAEVIKVNKMLTDDQILPLCRCWAKRFLRQAKSLGGRREAFDELTNVAYAASKTLEKLEGASTTIMWALVRYLKVDRERLDQERVRLDSLRRGEVDPERWAEKKEEIERLERAVRTLEWDEVKIVELYYRYDKTYIEIGRLFNRTPEWARWKMLGVVKKLRKELGIGKEK